MIFVKDHCIFSLSVIHCILLTCWRHLDCLQFGLLSRNLPCRVLKWSFGGDRLLFLLAESLLCRKDAHLHFIKVPDLFPKWLAGFHIASGCWRPTVGVPSFVSLLTSQPLWKVCSGVLWFQFAFTARTSVSPLSLCMSTICAVLCDESFFSLLLLFSLRKLFVITGLCCLL